MQKINAVVLYDYTDGFYTVELLFGTKSNGDMLTFIDDIDLDLKLRCKYKYITELLDACKSVLKQNGFYVKDTKEHNWLFSGIVAIEAQPYGRPHKFNVKYNYNLQR